MFVNSTKTTLSALRIAISYGDENSFAIIEKIILLFKWMKINVIFEPIKIGGQNYQKRIIYGLNEEDLTFLKKTNILLHTPIDYSSFDKKNHFSAEKYLDIFFQNCFIKAFFLKNKTDKIVEQIIETDFFSKNKQFILNEDSYAYYSNKSTVFNETILNEADFYYSFGARGCIFALNNFTEKIVINFVSEILKYLNFYQQAAFLQNFSKLDDAICEYKKNIQDNITTVDFEKIDFLPEIIWNDITTTVPNSLTNVETQLSGKFYVNELVTSIKDKKIKLPEGYELYQIFCFSVEFYPNINFWNEIVINPIIKLRKKEVSQKFCFFNAMLN